MTQQMLTMTVDGRPVRARQGQTLLEVCRALGKDIPTLCHHPALRPYASCRVCLVECEAGGRKSLVPSCHYPAAEGISVWTDSPAVKAGRQIVLELLLSRCPNNTVIRELAARYGVTTPPYATDDPDQSCILCGLCARVCEEVLGVAAIGFAGRGVDRHVDVPFEEASDKCLGCQACMAVCPTGHIRSVDDGPLRRMDTWKTDLELERCGDCGRIVAPVKLLDHLRKKLPEHLRPSAACVKTRRSRTAAKLAKTGTLGSPSRPASSTAEEDPAD